MPPLVGVAVKDTEPPAQIVLAEADMETFTGKFGFTIITTELLVAGLPVLHVSLDVSSTLTD